MEVGSQIAEEVVDIVGHDGGSGQDGGCDGGPVPAGSVAASGLIVPVEDMEVGGLTAEEVVDIVGHDGGETSGIASGAVDTEGNPAMTSSCAFHEGEASLPERVLGGGSAGGVVAARVAETRVGDLATLHRANCQWKLGPSFWSLAAETSSVLAVLFTDMVNVHRIIDLQEGGALELIAPPTHRARVGLSVNIPCKYKSEKLPVDLKFFAILWYKDRELILSYPDTDKQTHPRYSLDTGTALHGTADLSISNISGFDGGVYTCSVTYSPAKEEKDIQVDIQASPKIEITRKVVVANRESVLRSSITGFLPEDIDITWLRGSVMLNRFSVDKPLRNRDGTYNVSSSVTITPTEEDRERIFSCRVQHQSLHGLVQEDFQLVYGAHPRIIITGNIIVINAESVLRSSITGFYPVDIDITWLRDGEKLSGVTVEKPQSDPDGTYRVNSSVTITPTEEDRERIFSCRVQHQSLRDPLQSDFHLVYEDVTLKNGLIIAIAVLSFCVVVLACTAVYICRRKKHRDEVGNSTDRTPLGNITSESQQRSKNCMQNLDSCNTEEELKDKTEMDPLIDRTNRKKEGTLLDPEMKEITIEGGKLIMDNRGTLMCAISHYIVGKHTVKWLKIARDASEPVPVNSDIKIADISKDEPSGDDTAKLTFTPVQESDNGAVFICRLERPGSESPIERRIGPLRVTRTLLDPEMKEITIEGGKLIMENRGTLMCAISHYIVDEHTVKWLKIARDASEPVPVNFDINKIADIRKDEPSGDDIAKLTFTPVQESDNGAVFICRLERPGSESPIERRIGPLRVTRTLLDPEMKEITIEGGKLIMENRGTLMCAISHYIVDEHTVKWLKIARDASEPVPVNFDINKIADIRKDEPSGDDIAKLTFTPVQESDNGAVFICRLERPGSESPIERRIGPLRVTRTLLDPEMKEITIEGGKLIMGNRGTLMCAISHYIVGEHTVKWLKIARDASEPVPVNSNINKIANIRKDEPSGDDIGKLTFTRVQESDNGAVFICRLERPGSESPIERRIGPLRVTRTLLDPEMKEITIEGGKLIMGNRGTLMCAISNYIVGEHTVKWLKIARDASELVPVNSDIKIADIRKDEPSGDDIAKLAFTPVQESDNGAVFICRLERPGSESPIERRIGPLRVTRTLLDPEMKEITIGGKLIMGNRGTLMCAISNYIVGEHTVKWLKIARDASELVPVNSDINKIVVTRKDEPPGDIIAILTFTRVQESDNGAVFICRLERPGSESPIERRIGPLRVTRTLLDPEMKEITIEGGKLIMENRGTLMCAISHYIVDEHTVKWLKIARDASEPVPVNSDINKIADIRKDEPSGDDIAILTFTPVQESDNGAVFICRLERPGSESPIERRIGPLRVTRTLLDPEMKEITIEGGKLIMENRGTLMCAISHYIVDEHTVKWLKIARDASEPVPVNSDINKIADIRKDEPSGDDIAILTFTPVQESDNGAVFICRLERPGSESPIERRIGPLRVTRTLLDPEMKEITIEGGKLIMGNRGTLMCAISNYIVGEHTVKWLKIARDASELVPVNSDINKIVDTIKDEPSGDIIAILTFTPVQESDNGAVFICRLERPGSESPIERRIGPLRVTNPQKEPAPNTQQQSPMPGNPASPHDKQRTAVSPDNVTTDSTEPGTDSPSSACKQLQFPSADMGDTETLPGNNGDLSPAYASPGQEGTAERETREQ
ncbi:uncharacterized protein LOC134944449 [Pseudophryne corroboree]|uniref:uncharacterized protein LOC134944449 n=1 Tax=Pseudophryne corroboree TaxID=495146 RepID=UPI003081241F